MPRHPDVWHHHCLYCETARDLYYTLKRKCGLLESPDPAVAGLTAAERLLIGVLRPQKSRYQARLERATRA